MKIKIPINTLIKQGQTFVVNGKGMPRLRPKENSSFGDLIVTIDVNYPKKLVCFV